MLPSLSFFDCACCGRVVASPRLGPKRTNDRGASAPEHRNQAVLHLYEKTSARTATSGSPGYLPICKRPARQKYF